MSQQPVTSPPVPTPFLDRGQNTPSRGWLVWFQSVASALQNVWGAIAGNGPADPSKVAAWLPITQNGQTFYVAVYK